MIALGAVSIALGLVIGPRDLRVVPVSEEIFDPAVRETAAGYAAAKYAYWSASTILRWGALAGILALAGGAALAGTGRRLGRGRRLASAFFAAAMLLAMLAVATLPLSYAGGHRIDAAYGLSTQSGLQWLGDWARTRGFWIAVYATLLAAFLACLHRWPRRGWLVAAGGGLVVAVAGTFLAPRLIDPLFHDFTPLADESLEAEILAMGERAGVEIGRVRVMDASRRTRRLNAYVTGFGATRQVVLYDTLLEQAPRDEVLLVVAHEIGHEARGHVKRGLLFAMPGVVIGVGALSLLAGWRARRTGSSPGDPAAIPLLWLAVSVGLFLASPVTSAVSRGMEAEADRTALELTRDPDTFVEVEKRLVRANLSLVDPPGWLVFWLYTHPPVLERIGMAEQWRADHADRGDRGSRDASPDS